MSRIFLAAAVILALGTGAMMANWDRLERDNNAFAKDCNERGGEARFDINARQCIGAKDQTNG
jgi:hypothetical protein